MMQTAVGDRRDDRTGERGIALIATLFAIHVGRMGFDRSRLGIASPLVAVIEGAGGRMTDWAGRPLRADGDGRALAVGDPERLGEVVSILNG